MFRMLIAALLMLGFAALGGGCKQATGSVTSEAMDTAIEKDSDGKVSVETNDGSFEATTGDKVKIPDDFPQDVPLPKNAEVISSVKSPEGFVVMLQTSDASDKVVAQYTAEMKAKGWGGKVIMDMGESQMLTYNKDNEAHTVGIVVAKIEDVTHVQITIVSSQTATSN